MQALTTAEVEQVCAGKLDMHGGPFIVLLEGVAINALYDGLKVAVPYILKNSYMGQGKFPPVPRAGHE